MRIARWNRQDSTDVHEGFIIEEQLHPFPGGKTVAQVLADGLSSAHELFAEVQEEAEAPYAGCRDSLSDVTLMSPVVPASIRDFVAFEEHVEGVSGSVDGKNEVVPEWYEAPTFYFTNPHTVRATGETVPIPDTRRLDMEAELAAVIGGVPDSQGENLSADAAARHIFGYTVMNDWSARDLQSREMKVRLGPCKGKDFGLTLGPWIVTADELTPFVDDDGFLELRGEAVINGALVGEDLVSNMGWPMPELVAYASQNSRVVPGDVLGSGTFGNGGCLGELWGLGREIAALEPGDEVRISFEGVGEIVNIVGDRVPVPELPRARRRSRNRKRTAGKDADR
jgi:2-keto-4-pentenoate hydratase/2-oxohepta-3-ene-1,7-dioic acid hydratase in catechol pathway